MGAGVINVKKVAARILGAITLGLLFWGLTFFFQNFRGAGVIFEPVPENLAEIVEASSSPFSLPKGFTASIFAKNLPNVRVMVKDPLGNFWVSQPSEGVISTLEVNGGKVMRQKVVFSNLMKPHGLALDPLRPFMLYIAEENKISRVALYSDSPIEKIADLPAGGNHTSRTIGFGPDGRLYVAIGSSCNVCLESDSRRAKIFSMNADGSDVREYASGLRNTVFFAWDEKGRMWGTDMGRDYLGDNLPPDEVNVIEVGKNYGWPTCFGKNIHDGSFDKNTYVRNPCSEPYETPSFIDIPAHSAPLGLAFVPKVASDSAWPKDYEGSLFIAYHGSWNRTTPTGYKIVRVKFDQNGNPSGIEDFMTGWRKDGALLGRPVALLMLSDGRLFITDDKAGVIYKVEYKK